MKIDGLIACYALAVFACAAGAASGAEPVAVTHAWVRATVPGQQVAGVYMDIRARAPLALIAVETPVAPKAELHMMSMDDGVMRMRPLERLPLAANRTVALTPGGEHVMLIGIRRQLKAGERVPLKLIVEDARGVKSTLQVEAEVRAVGAAATQ